MASIHTGHRQRAKSEFLARGLEGVPDHRALELLLFYAIPQGDVNPLAHELINHFGDLAGVFNATYDQLLEVKGVGSNTATLIKLLPALAGRYLERRTEISDQLFTTWQFREVLMPCFFGARNEMAWLVCMDGKNKLIACRKLGEGIADQVAILTRKVMETALSCNAVKVALAHNHVSGVAMPSAADLHTTQELRRVLQQVSIELVDHFIVADDDMVSLRESGCFER